MGVLEWLVGFAVFLGVAVAISLALEEMAPGTGTNNFVGIVVGLIAGGMVTRLFGDE